MLKVNIVCISPKTSYLNLIHLNHPQAYKNFGARVRALKRKLDELIPTLSNAAPSPPQRDEDVPSPGPDEDLDLPAAVDNNDGDDDSKFRTLVNK